VALTSTSPYIFMAWCLIKPRDNITFSINNIYSGLKITVFRMAPHSMIDTITLKESTASIHRVEEYPEDKVSRLLQMLVPIYQIIWCHIHGKVR
jgi:hypothetical protein